MEEFEITFSDLTPECQAALLKFMGVASPKDLNWDIPGVPIAIIPREWEED